MSVSTQHHRIHDIAETLRLGLPLAAAQLAQMAMGVTDTAFLGALGPDALAAGGLATSLEIGTLVILGRSASRPPGSSRSTPASDRPEPGAGSRPGSSQPPFC